MNEIPETRNSLLLRLADPANEAAWQDFVQIYEPVIVRMAMRRGLQVSDAQDLSQEVLTRVARTIGKWNPEREQGSFRGWLAKITRNLVVDYFRKQSRQPNTVSDSALAEQSSPVEADLFAAEEQHQIFCWAGDRARRNFSETTWSAFWSSCVDGKTPQATAKLLDISVGAVYIARSRVLAKIKEIVEQAGAELPGKTIQTRSVSHEDR